MLKFYRDLRLEIKRRKAALEALVIGQFGVGFVTDEMLKADGIKEVVGNHSTQISQFAAQALNNVQLDPIPYFDTFRRYAPLFSGYGSVAMPNNAAGRGQSVVKGVTLKNELNYNNVTWDEWTKTGAVGDATGIVMTADGISYRSIKLSTSFKAATKYGLLYSVLSSNIATYFILEPTSSAVPYTKISKEVGNAKATFTTPSTINTNMLKMALELNTEPSGNKIKLAPNIRIFELPTGSTIESDFTNLTADQLAIKYPYVKGDKVYGSGAQRLVSRGKNLFDGWELGGIYLTSGIEFSTTDKLRSKDYIPVASNTAYVAVDPEQISTNARNVQNVLEFDKNKVFIKSTLLISTLITFTTQSNTTYVRFVSQTVGASSFVISKYTSYKTQLELGSTATPYEPYYESIVYTPVIGNSLPNGTVDQINILSAQHMQNVQEYTLQASDIAGVIDRTNYTQAYTADNFLTNISGVAGVDGLQGTVLISGWAEQAFSAAGDYIANKFSTRSPASLWFNFPLGTTRSAAALALAGTKIYYQLATPVITPLQLHGASEFELYPNGSVYSEPCISGWTNTASTVITTSALPIKSIRKVTKYTYVGHQRVETDVTANASTADNLTLVIASFDATANYFYDCEYDSQYSTNPLMEINAEVLGGVLSHDYAAGATTKTLTANESLAEYFILTNAGGAAQLIMQPQSGVTKTIENNSGQTITVKTATSTGVTIATGKIATLKFNGTDFKKISEV